LTPSSAEVWSYTPGASRPGHGVLVTVFHFDLVSSSPERRPYHELSKWLASLLLFFPPIFVPLFWLMNPSLYRSFVVPRFSFARPSFQKKDLLFPFWFGSQSDPSIANRTFFRIPCRNGQVRNGITVDSLSASSRCGFTGRGWDSKLAGLLPLSLTVGPSTASRSVNK